MGMHTATRDWYEMWLSVPRLQRYLNEADGDPDLAVTVYEWNLQLSAALTRDVAHLEIALRNAYDRVMRSVWHGPGHWLLDSTSPVTTPLLRTRGGKTTDLNSGNRRSVNEAVRRCRRTEVTPDAVITELPFGFWRHCTDAAHEKTLWVPYLHRAWARGTDRTGIDRALSTINTARNRAAHHEPLFTPGRFSASAVHTDIIDVLQLLLPPLAEYVRDTSTVPALSIRHPCR